MTIMRKEFHSMKNKTTADITALTLGELAVAVLTVAGFLVAKAAFNVKFDFRVITGALLGATVSILNYVFLTVTVNRALNRFLDIRGTAEMDEDEAARFASENSMQFQNAINLSFAVRTVSMLATLVAAFVLDFFSPIATVIPLLAFRPILMLISTVNERRSSKSKMPACSESDYSTASSDTTNKLDKADDCKNVETKENDN